MGDPTCALLYKYNLSFFQIGRLWSYFLSSLLLVAWSPALKKGPWKVHSSTYHYCMVSWKAQSYDALCYSIHLFHKDRNLSINFMYKSKLFPNLSRRNNEKKPLKNVVYVGAGDFSIAVPLRCSQWLSPKRKILFIIMRWRAWAYQILGDVGILFYFHWNIVIFGSMQD